MFLFVLEQGDDDCVTVILWEFSLLPAADEEFVEFDIECWSSIFLKQISVGLPLIQAAFPLFNFSVAFSVTAVLGGSCPIQFSVAVVGCGQWPIVVLWGRG